MMMKTEELIHSLAEDTVAAKQLWSPARLVSCLISILLIYAAVVGVLLGFRADLLVQLHRPFFLTEISLLLFIIFSSLIAAIFLIFPDRYQNKSALYWPIYSLPAFMLVLLVQVFLPIDSRMFIPIGKVHAMECTICIAAIAMIPSGLIFIFLRRGATVYPFLSGIYAVLASSGIGCLMLRLAETDDYIMHITLWHYIPTLIFAAIGAFIGRIFLKW